MRNIEMVYKVHKTRLTKFWQKQFCTVFWDTVYTRQDCLAGYGFSHIL